MATVRDVDGLEDHAEHAAEGVDERTQGEIKPSPAQSRELQVDIFPARLPGGSMGQRCVDD